MPGARPELELLRVSTLSSLPRPYIYLVRNGDIYKMGATDDLERKLKNLELTKIIYTAEMDNAVSVKKQLHKTFAGCRIAQTEHYQLSELLVDNVIFICKANGSLVDTSPQSPIFPAMEILGRTVLGAFFVITTFATVLLAIITILFLIAAVVTAGLKFLGLIP